MKRDFLYIRFMCMFLIISLFSSMTMISIGFSSPTTTKLNVDPSKVECWTPAFGKTFTINVNIANVSNLQGFELKLYWNTTLLDLVNVSFVPFLNPFWFPFKFEINETLGRCWFNITTIDGPPASGSGTLVKLTFKITYDPVWPENVTSALDLAETKLVDSQANLIPHDVYDGRYSCYSTPLLRVTAMTDKPSYWGLLENIHIYGNLTLGFSPVRDGVVALEVDDPQNGIVVIRALPTGIPPAGQKVEIINVIPCGGPPNYAPKNSFNRGTLAYFNVTIKNNDNETRGLLITLNIYDVNLTPLNVPGVPMFRGQILAGTIASVIFSFPIPDTASVGEARVYASVLTELPRVGGTAYCPEKSATFNILGSSSAGATTQISSSPEGTYDLTFKLPFNSKPGNYTIYANSNYTTLGRTQKATKNVTFKVRVPDINSDRTVDIGDVVIVAIAFGSAAVDDPYTPWDETQNWNPAADLNYDGIVDIGDIVMVAIYFGWSDP